MDSYVRPARKGAVALIAVTSILGGILLAWHLVNPSTIGGTSTPELLLVLGLLVLPLAAMGAWQVDRLAATCSPAGRSERE